MPIPVITQNPGVSWAQEVEFPFPIDTDASPINIGSGSFNRYFQARGKVFGNSNIASDNFPGTIQAAGGGVINIIGGGQVCAQCSGGAAPGNFVRMPMGPIRYFLDTGNGANLAAGAEMATGSKAYWLQWLWRTTTAAPGNLTGLLMQPTDNRNNVGWPTNVVGVTNRGGFGFFGDGAGQWAYQSYNRTGVGLLRETIALPAHTLTDWNRCELFITNARPGLPATLEIWFNGAFVATRNWTGALLEDYGAGEWSWVPTVAAGDADNMDFKQLIMRQGGFSRAGVAL